jgi:hypothetical protein
MAFPAASALFVKPAAGVTPVTSSSSSALDPLIVIAVTSAQLGSPVTEPSFTATLPALQATATLAAASVPTMSVPVL